MFLNMCLPLFDSWIQFDGEANLAVSLGKKMEERLMDDV